MEDLAKFPGLKRRKDTFYVRVRVPKDLLSLYAPTKEITKSLNTKSYSDAVLKYKSEYASIHADFEIKRKSAKNGKPPTDMLQELSDETLISFAQDWCETAWDKAVTNHASQKSSYSKEEHDEIRSNLFMETLQASDEVKNIGNPYNGSSQWSGSVIADEILKHKNITCNKGTERYSFFRLLCSQAHLEYTTRHLNFWDGAKHKPTSPMFIKGKAQQYHTIPVMHGHGAIKPITIAKLYEEHMNNPSAEKGDSARKNYIIPMRILMHVVGKNKNAHEITREDCKKARELMMGLPSNYKKKLGDVDIPTAIKKGKEQGLELATVGTVNGYLQKMSSVLNFGLVEGYIYKNPAIDLQLKDKQSAKDKRHPFSTKVLNVIFSSGVYSESDISIYKNYQPPAKLKKAERAHYSRFWVPLIALYSGMRLNEICQLNVSDIQYKNGIAVLNVRTEFDEEDGVANSELKKLKTEQSNRIVPVHPMLKKIGLLEYVESVKKAGVFKLFPDVKVATTGYHSGNFSKYFSRHLKAIGVKTDKTSFHSFRHNFRDAEREAEMPEHISQQLGGWTTGKTDANYGSGVKIETLSKWMDKIDYPEVALDKL
ncbi:MAG TPA: hypothetical protein DCM27_02180 [Rhodospirillaceae bacterium]|nr:hypothetical protein [Rhodospirillaceae bacterium]